MLLDATVPPELLLAAPVAGSSEASIRGHLRQRGEAWELRAYAGVDPITNRQKYVTRTFRGGKREAEEALARLVTEVSGGSHAAQDTTIGDLLREWLALAKPELSPSTARGYDWIITTYIFPTLEKVPLARLKTSQLDRFYAKLRDEGARTGIRFRQQPSGRCMPSSGGRSSKGSGGDGSERTRQRSPRRPGCGVASSYRRSPMAS